MASFKFKIALSLIGILGVADLAFSQQMQLFYMRRWHGSFRFRYQAENRVSPEQTRERTTNENLILRNSGFVINPYLLSYQWSGDLGFLQERYIGDVISRKSRGRFINQSLTTSLFTASTHPLTIQLSRSTNTLNLDFGGKTTYDITNYQFTLDLPSFYLISRFHGGQRKIRDKWSRAGFTTERDQIRRFFNYNGRIDREHSSVDVDYDFFHVSNRIFSDRSYGTHNGRFRMRRSFGQNKANLWEAGVFLVLRTGLTNYRNAKHSQSLTFQHFPWLTSSMRYSFSITNTLQQTSLQHSAFGTIKYRLYNSLRATLIAGGTTGNSKLGNFGTRSLNSGVNYTKKLFLSGRFQIGYTRTYALTERVSESNEQQVVNERHIILGGLPIILGERYIVPSSIRVFDEDSKFLYEEGEEKDYSVRAVGEYVEIVYNPLGRIREDDVLLVDYRFQTLPTMSFSTDTRIFNTSLIFGPLSVYYFKNKHDLDFITGSFYAQSFLGDLVTQTAGTSLSLRGERLGILLQAEKKVQDSKSLAYVITQLRNSLFFKPKRNLSISTNFSSSLLDHTREDFRIKSYTLQTNFRWRLTLDMILEGFGQYKIRRENHRPEELISEFGFTLHRYWQVVRMKLS
ncbi:MAG: hypothetical protein ACE5I1_16175, partial [bacterium]